MWRQLRPAFLLMLFFTALTGIVYPAVVTGLCQAFFHHQANGSLIRVNGQIVGSRLIGQNFTQPQYFHPRPSACDYDASASAASNYGPTNEKLIARIEASIVKFRKDNPDYSGPLPADLVTASASGLDPDISIASAEAQAARVAEARGVSVSQVRAVIRHQEKMPVLGFLGEPRVNVLELNLALDRTLPRK